MHKITKTGITVFYSIIS